MLNILREPTYVFVRRLFYPELAMKASFANEGKDRIVRKMHALSKAPRRMTGQRYRSSSFVQLSPLKLEALVRHVEIVGHFQQSFDIAETHYRVRS